MLRAHALLSTIIACAVLAATQSSAQTISVDLVAEFGDPVPDSATLMRGFDLPAIDANGRVVFRGNVGQITPSYLIFQTVGLSSQVIRMPDIAPGFTNDQGDPLFFLPFSSNPLMNPAGTLAFTSAIRDESGSASVSSVLFTGTDVSNLSHIARSDTFDLPGLSEFVSADISAFALNNSGTAAFITSAFGAEPGLHALFRTEGGSAATRIAIEGEQAPDTPAGSLFSVFWQDSLVINVRGDVAFRGTLRQGAGGVTFSNDEGIWCYCDGVLKLVARKGDVAPGGAFANPFKGFLDKTAISPTGEVAFQGRLGNSFSPSGIWRGTNPADLRDAAVSGVQKPTSLGFTENLFGFSGPVFASSSELLFSANGLATTDAIWKEVGGVLQPIVRGDIFLSDGTFIPGDVAPGTVGVFFDFGKFAVSPSGKVVFTGNYTGSGWSTPRGIWAQDADGVLQDVLQPGDVLLTQRGLRTIADAAFLDGPGPVSGKSTGFSDGFEVALLATFDSNLTAIIRAPVGNIPPPGNLYSWSGAAGDDNWDTNNAGTTNWIDTRGLPRTAPGSTGLELVTIRDSVPATGVVLDQRVVSIGSLTAEGSLTVAQPLTLAQNSSIESLQMEAGFPLGTTGNELITTAGQLTLSGDGAWRSGWIDATTGSVLNQGTFTIDGMVSPAPTSGMPPPRRILGKNTNIANTLQKDNVDLDNATIENLTGGTWKLVKGNVTVGLGGGAFNNTGSLIKPESVETADSAIDAFYSAGPMSHTDIDAGKLVLRGGAEFMGGAEILLNTSRTQGLNLATTSELELAAAGAVNRTYQFKAGKTTFNVAGGFVHTGDGILRVSSGATLSVLSNSVLELNSARLFLDGGDIVGSGKITVNNEFMEWRSGTIGRSDLGPGSAQIVFNRGNLNIPVGAARTLAGTLTLASPTSSTFQNADLILDGGKVLVQKGAWFISEDSDIQANVGGRFDLIPDKSFPTLRVDVNTVSDFSASLNNRGTVQIRSGRLRLTGPIEQVTGNVLTGGTWRIQEGGAAPSPPILDMPNHTITTIGEAATVILGGRGSFPQLQVTTIDGKLDLRTGAALQTGSLTNNGELTVFGNGARLTVIATLTNLGLFRISNGAAAELARLESRPGSINVIHGSLTAQVLRLLGGTFSGNGTINGQLLENIVGHLAPGQSPGTLTVNADYVQASTAALNIELGGLIPGVGHDQLTINGSVTLAGELRLIPVKGFLPLVGQAYEILTVTGGTLTGEFETIVGPGEYAVAYSSGSVTVTVLAMPGDSDGDNDLDLFDHRDLIACASVPGVAPGPGCSVFDMNADDSIDLLDWCAFQTVFTGPGP